LQVSSTTATNDYSLPDNTRKPVQSLDKDAFLRLLIEQLKNQDPMSPQDPNEFVAQMAQFSMLEQLTSLNQGMTQLKKSQEMMEAAALLGQQVNIMTKDGTISGQVEKVTLEGEDINIFVGGEGYNLADIYELLGNGFNGNSLSLLTQIKDEMSQLRESVGGIASLLGRPADQ